MADLEAFRTRHWQFGGGERVSRLTLTADNGALIVAIGGDGRPPQAQHTLTLADLDGLMQVLPALREWVASGRPAVS